MDTSIRKNDHCIIGLPGCDFVFSSTRTCFIAYGFETSPLEVSILRNLLESQGIQCEEAGGQLAPGQNAFCQKICSKIITSQFCIVLLNQDEKNGILVPNANVNMEYGLMLGFNKYLIPFQKEAHTLPFNVAALDTVKYESSNFERKASEAIKVAIKKTTQSITSPPSDDQIVTVFLLSKKLVYASLDDIGEKNIFRFGAPFGFHLLNDFSGMIYHFFGNFTSLRPEAIVWRLMMLNDLITERYSSLGERVNLGVITETQKYLAESLFRNLKVLVLTTSSNDKNIVLSNTRDIKLIYNLQIYTLSDIEQELMELGNKNP